MKLICPISGLEWKAEFMQATATAPHPYLISTSIKKLPAQLSLFQTGKLEREETHLLFISLLGITEHVTFHTPLILTPELEMLENAQMQRLANLAFSGCFQKKAIELPHFIISKEVQDISELLGIWEDSLEDYRISAMLAKQEHEIRSMLERVQRAFSSPLVKSRTKIIIQWMNKVVSLPTFQTLHPISGRWIACNKYWEEIMTLAVEGNSFISYPEKDLVEFKSHLEENLPLNYSQEFSLLEELQMAITRKQNYFGYSFSSSDEVSYSVNDVKPKLRREDYPDALSYLNAIKANRKQNS